jgi:hypothetical protein
VTALPDPANPKSCLLRSSSEFVAAVKSGGQ